MKTYYHASPEDIPDCSDVVPGESIGKQTFVRPAGHPGSVVYLSRNLWDAEYWAEWIADVWEVPCHVYEVTASETTRHYVKEVDGYEYRAPLARVTARVRTVHPERSVTTTLDSIPRCDIVAETDSPTT